MDSPRNADNSTLSWVRSELDDTLKQAAEALETYADDPTDGTRLRFCATYLHQVRGTLHMLELAGLASLAEEMELLLDALINDRVEDVNRAQEALMQAILQLSDYLERVHQGEADSTSLVTPLLNQLRAARGADIAVPGAGFNPDLSAAGAGPREPVGGLSLAEVARERRPRYQKALLAFVQGRARERSLEFMQDVLDRLDAAASDERASSLWAVGAGFMDAVRLDDAEDTRERKGLLGQIDRQIKRVIDEGEERLVEAPPDGLLRSLLFQVSRTPAESERIAAIRERFRLDASEAGGAAASAPSRSGGRPGADILNSVADAIREDVSGVKDALDLYVRSEQQDNQRLAEAGQTLGRIADTLSMLGLPVPRKVVRDQIATTDRVAEGEAVADQDLMDLAKALLYVESALSSLSDLGERAELEQESDGRLRDEDLFDLEYRAVYRTAIREAVADVGGFKDAIVSLIEKEDYERFGEIEPLIHRLQGALSMLGLERAGRTLDAIGHCVRSEIIEAGSLPDSGRLDALADGITSLEYYLEAVLERRGGRDAILDVAENAIRRLGYDPDNPVAAPEPPAPDVGGDATPEPDAADADVAAAPAPAAIEPAEAASPGAEAPAEPAPQAAGVPSAAGETQAQPQTGKPGGVNFDVAVCGDELDPEILEIFLEEADECLATIREEYPRWRQDLEQTDPLITVRRMFHTLKGSGRLAGALLLGELAWAVERLLNRVIDGHVAPDHHVFDVIDRTLGAVPELIRELQGGDSPEADVRAIMHKADILADPARRGELDNLDGGTGGSPDGGVQPPDDPAPDPEDDGPGGDGEAFTAPVEPEPEAVHAPEEGAAGELPGGEPEPDDRPPGSRPPDGAAEEGGEEGTPGESGDLAAQSPLDPEESSERAGSEGGASGADAGDEAFGEALSGLSDVSDDSAAAAGGGTGPEASADSDDPAAASDPSDDATAAGGVQSPHEDAPWAAEKPTRAAEPGAEASDERPPDGELDGEAPGADPAQCGADETPVDEPGDADGPCATDPSSAANDADAVPRLDPALYEIFRNETIDHLEAVDRFLEHCAGHGDICDVSDDLLRALHTLSGSARMADVTPVAGLAREMELHAAMRREQGVTLAPGEVALLREGVELIRAMVDALGDGSPLPEAESLRERLRSAAEAEPGAAADDEAPAADAPGPSGKHPAPDADDDASDDLLALFLEEADDLLQFLESTVTRWEDSPDRGDSVAELQRSLHTLKGGARLARFERIAALCHALESLARDVEGGDVPADDALFTCLHDALGRLGEMVNAAGEGGDTGDATEQIDTIQRLRGTQGAPTPPPAPAEDADSELVEVFLEEATEILQAIDAAQSDWMARPGDDERLHDVERALHTLKGGARMAGYLPVANLSHALESLLHRIRTGDLAPGTGLFDLLEQSHDRLHALRDAAAQNEPLASPDDLLEQIERLARGESLAPGQASASAEGSAALGPEQTDAPGTRAPAPAPDTPGTSQPGADGSPAAEAQPGAGAQPKATGDTPGRLGSDQIRVPADLLDQLVNYAGEVSIYRARLDQQVGAFRFNLGELDQTVQRLRDQLRTLEIETEAQILYRHHRGGDGGGDPGGEDGQDKEFDPLELDRFTRMQELSRGLGESVNDLGSIQGLLDNLARESETLLLQQSRVNTELQDGLMRTRMVPFSSLAPRLRRIVRQTASELGKQARIRVEGGQGEMDRTVLDRVTAPLEHMLRNAVAHGIESPQERTLAGKGEGGQITLTLDREGADVVLHVADDGAGMNLEAIRQKALDRGILRQDREPTRREVMQCVLEQGFTTADEVTQIAGRGVGMDVVNSEIKQLGGSLEIDSEPGRGTEFTVRLPFTLAMNQALLCYAGDQAYAIPLSSIEGVVRVTPDQMETYLSQGEDARYHYAGQDYPVTALTDLLGIGEAHLHPQSRRVPLVLVQTGDYRMAVQVDGLIGSREIVVKSVGPQISTVPGIFGATILADGRVVLILDMGAMMRLASTVGEDPDVVAETPVAEVADEPEPLVMVVDDSITMRKVAARLLERNNLRVVTAKDGVDAVTQLQDRLPDAMLLDIEMPRMDGYEVATHMRNDDRLRDVPIIMITSRTGEKHRERAFEIGVDRYLGKPYQEGELLGTIQEVLEHGYAST